MENWLVSVAESIKKENVTVVFAYGQTTLKAPGLVGSRKLRRVGPDRYLDWRTTGNARRCKLFIPFSVRPPQGAVASPIRERKRHIYSLSNSENVTETGTKCLDS